MMQNQSIWMNYQSWKKELNRIAQIKDEMHKTRERAITDRLWPKIETLSWVLNEILVLSREE